ncbi:TPA: hypothetical protein N2A03_005867 [Pseudomonas aeruginosa]|uniref:hypothetical protein n=1 Tax=Pseudomonas aeruginosa TaxID=287 RepID=UPI0011590E73|nr:hypothetical protein [Pseudomonas aeruginosa]EKX0336204.1 hypothetical protein [Pseudomonas aeruginosa]EKX7254792.1 hypothetical protein [Pseudomonas aeruginosa]MDU0594147.1 hypothetical protein [Pseudomonas aeruginosa]MDY1107159.1 hypothetical protein [Pseudomonas aeruginosa]MDY1191198.1 hypothetical protein [Pseudomonas aeruginosa]
MVFTPDMESASHRNFQAAQTLHSNQHRHAAGYLYGLAAECAIKAMMLQAGIPVRPQDERGDDPYYAHFPNLKTILRENMQGRRASGALARFINDDRFFSQWDIKVRYCKNDQVSSGWIEMWREQASQAVSSIGS